MRIIGGNFKGKKLFLPDDKNTRPLKDLVKESIFNIIRHSNKININIENSFILDLFSGTGSFGLECISRGAKQVIFFEKYLMAFKILEKNIKCLKDIQNYKLYNDDCFEYFKSDHSLNCRFDIIFIDPPYKEVRINEIIERLIKKKLLRKNGCIIIHRHKNDTVEITPRLKIIENRIYGISKVYFGN